MKEKLSAEILKKGLPQQLMLLKMKSSSMPMIIFILKSQASVVYPLEDGQLEVHTSSQHPTESQHVVSHALGLSSKDVLVQVKRLGGGFGGKESQAAPFAAMAAVGAQNLIVP